MIMSTYYAGQFFIARSAHTAANWPDLHACSLSPTVILNKKNKKIHVGLLLNYNVWSPHGVFRLCMHVLFRQQLPF